MTETIALDPDMAWAAFEARDRHSDGRFVGAVTTTGIYCKPSCPARHPKRAHVVFYRSPEEARARGFRACLRCKPDEVGRDRIAVARAVALLEAADETPGLAALAAAVGYAPHHFHRLFKRATGVTPAAYARGLKAQAAARALTEESNVTHAIYEAGYSAPSRFYEGAAPRLGMSPSVWARGGAGVTIRWTLADTSLGPMLVAATDKGLCRVSFDEGEAALRARFPKAAIVAGGAALADLAAQVVASVESPDRDRDLPLDVRGTAFQEAVWQALRDIPLGETRSYAELAAAVGNPGAVRAAGSACGANPVSIVVPCHRAQRSDGTLGGYAYGIDRKVTLRRREGGGMSGFVIRGLDPAPFAPLYGLSDAELAEHDVVRRVADTYPGFPCRVTLADAQPGEHLLLLNYEHLPVASPYRSRHAIYVREGAHTAALWHDEIPEILSRRLLSVRGFDDSGMMIEADVCEGGTLRQVAQTLLERNEIAYLHVHNARPGCFAARIDRLDRSPSFARAGSA